jgi:phage terminase large subunit
VSPEAAKLLRWKRNPVSFVRECLKAELDDWQAEFVQAFNSNQRLALKACKGPGKTAVIAMLCWLFLVTRRNCKIAATSITSDNLADNLWSELAKWQARSPILQSLFTWTKTRIVCKEAPENWFMSARTWPKSANAQQQANTLAGLHADYLMFVLDESGGIPDAVMAAAEGGLSTGKETKILQAGNPTHLEGPLYRACTSERRLWYVQEITGDPDDPKRSSRVSIKWANEQIEKYGRENPWVLVNVFGKFPPASINTLLGPDEVEAAMNRMLMPKDYEFAQKRLGVDVARFGDDSTVIAPRQGLRAFPMEQMRNARGPEIAARIALAKQNWDWEACFVDDTGGFGGAVIDSMLQGGMQPIPVNAAGKADDPRYFNRRSEMHFRAAEWVKRGGALPNDRDLKAEMTAVTYTFVNGKFRVMEKDQIKEIIGRSPDRFDALCQSFAWVDMPNGVKIDQASLPKGELYGLALDPEEAGIGQSKGNVKSEFNPFRETALR